MKTALLIHSYAMANDMVQRHWSYFERSGFDIFGVGRINSHCTWPRPVHTKAIGPDGYLLNGQLPERLVDTFRWFLNDPVFEPYTHAMVIEPDCVFFRAPPVMDVTCAATLAGGGFPGFLAKAFYHTPWWMNRETADAFVKEGDLMLSQGIREGGTPDFFLGLAFERMGRPVTALQGTFSKNTIDIPADAIMARDRFRSGEIWFLHGVKTEAQLKFVTT